MIRVETMSKAYGDVTVVDRVTFDVGAREAVALWGPNGAGKSTIVRCLLGLARFNGRAEVAGLDVRSSGKAVRRLIGYVPQELSFYDDLDVGETVDLSASLRRIDPARADEALATVGLQGEHAKRVGALSGGMKQRLAIALALLHDPPVLLLDEPTSNLDVGARESVIELLESLRRDRCLLLTSHHLEEVGMLVDRVLAMESGRVTLECEPAALAEELGLRSWLHLVVAEDQLSGARSLLEAGGFNTRMNSRGILVEVSAQQKGAALALLHSGGLEILDLEVWR
ncbi:MAG: ABC transporter ATP-binding protein [Acidimicrobiia bacterium]|nr:ABC transporter ATP-binding protein [Acidimicrobiia bacterium]